MKNRRSLFAAQRSSAVTRARIDFLDVVKMGEENYKYIDIDIMI